MRKIFSKTGLLVLMVAIVVLLGASYAGYTRVLETQLDLSSGGMDFHFDGSREDFSISIQKDGSKELWDLNANIDYDGKTLKISDMKPIDMSYLKDGDLRFIIQYGIKASNSSSLAKAAIPQTIKDKNEFEYVSFEKTTKTPQWTIKTSSGDWSTGGFAVGSASEAICGRLPDSLGDFKLIKTLAVDENEKIMHGVIILEQAEIPSWFSSRPINLSSLCLPEEVLESIGEESDLVLSIEGAYGFEIPLAIDQFNVGKM
jgi:hypothetical protein